MSADELTELLEQLEVSIGEGRGRVRGYPLLAPTVCAHIRCLFSCFLSEEQSPPLSPSLPHVPFAWPRVRSGAADVRCAGHPDRF